MRVAVTGANGLLGGAAVAQLAGLHEVLAVGRGACRLVGLGSPEPVEGRADKPAGRSARPEPVEGRADKPAGRSARPELVEGRADQPTARGSTGSPRADHEGAKHGLTRGESGDRSLSPTGGEGQGEGARGSHGFTWAPADLGDGHSVEAALLDFRPEAVLHAGAATDVDGCERDPELAWRVNVGGTEQVARACRALGARLVAVSTDYVFDGEAGPYAEDDFPNPRGAYAHTKRCGEEAALLVAPDCAVARVAVVYSGRPGAKPTFATQVVEKLSRGEPVSAFSDQLVSTTLAASGAAMCLELLLETSYRGVLHTSDATVLSRVEFAERVAREFGLAGEIRAVRTADVKLLAPRPLRGGLVTTRAAALLRAKPLGIDEALRRFHEEWRARARGA